MLLPQRRKGYSLLALLSNRANIIFGKFGLGKIAASEIERAPFSNLVVGVISSRTQEQMGGIDAGRIVALVANQHPIGDGAVGKFIAVTWRNIVAAVYGKPSIASGSATLPFPALIRAALVYLAPKSFDGRGVIGNTQSVVMTHKVADWLAFDLPLLCVGSSRNWGRLTASALTKFGAIRGIIGEHKKSPFLCQAQDAANVAGQLLLGCYSCIVPYF